MNKKLTALIVDDEKDARDLLKYIFQNSREVEIVGEAWNAESALFKFMELKPDMVFLDLVMPGKNGMDLIELLKKQKIETYIVIVSAHKDMAIRAIKNEVYDFVLKPVDQDHLKAVVTKISLRRRKGNKHSMEIDKFLDKVKQETKLRLSSVNSHILIDPKEIIYCEAEGSYTHLHLDNGKIELANTNLGKIENILADYHFFRIGRSTLINLDKLWKANQNDNSCILLSNKKEVKLYGSKKQIKELCKLELNNQ